MWQEFKPKDTTVLALTGVMVYGFCKHISKVEPGQSQQDCLTVLEWLYQSVAQAGEWLVKNQLKSARIFFTQGPKVMSLSARVTYCDVSAWL